MAETSVAIALISCGKAKRTIPTVARDLYSSPLFRNTFRVARGLASNVLILSSKYGAISSEDVIEPYDSFLRNKTAYEKCVWADEVSRVLSNSIPDHSNVVFFGGREYLDPLRDAAEHHQWNIIDPLSGLDLFKRSHLVSRVARIFARRDSAAELYEALDAAASLGNRQPVQNVMSKGNLPRRGVYIFSDPSEPSHIDGFSPRIVRIGTHAITSTSKATLRQRLRTHHGKGDGGGSHRSSVFRLHVGNAIRASERSSRYPSWGIGSSAPSVTLEEERDLELRVSDHIKGLLVTVVPLDDNPSPRSTRALVEKGLISLLTENHDYLDPPSPDWLGKFSPREEISSSGLWNLQHVGARAESKASAMAISLLRSYSP